MPPGPWAMSVMMQPLQPSATSGANSVMTPAGVMRAILAGADVNSVPSVNQRLPSDPLVIARGWLLAVGTLNCFSAPTGAASAALPSDNTRPTASVAASTRPALRDMSPPLELAAQDKEAREPRRPTRGPGWYLRAAPRWNCSAGCRHSSLRTAGCAHGRRENLRQDTTIPGAGGGPELLALADKELKARMSEPISLCGLLGWLGNRRPSPLVDPSVVSCRNREGCWRRSKRPASAWAPSPCWRASSASGPSRWAAG